MRWQPLLLVISIASFTSLPQSLAVSATSECARPRTGYKAGLNNVSLELQGEARRFRVFVPSKYQAKERIPLWILSPGSYDPTDTFLAQSNIIKLAEEKVFAFAALQGDQDLLNVGLHAQAVPDLPDDVEYTKAVLRDVTSKLCIDMDRIRCTGFSRGARFCSRLASELSSFISGIGPVAGVRYPSPNNATRPMPIIAFHGTKDPINLYWGKGDPQYWDASVPDVLHRWADFNKCQKHEWSHSAKHVAVSKHYDCKNDASVVLVLVEEGGHTWPGTDFKFSEEQFGTTTQEVDANLMMWKFFLRHPGVSICHTAKPGEPCYAAVQEAMRTGLKEHPEWKDLISPESSFTDYQAILRNGIWADCPKPCEPERSAQPQAMVAPPLPLGNGPVSDSVATGDAPELTASTTLTASITLPRATAPVADAAGTVLDKAEALKSIQGRWTHQSNPGQFIEVVHNNQIRWDGGPMTAIVPEGDDEFTTVWQGSNFHAKVSNGQLRWDDGDVWIPVTHETAGGTKSDVEVSIVRRIKDKGSWWLQSHSTEVADHHLNNKRVAGTPVPAAARRISVGFIVMAILAGVGGLVCLTAIPRIFLRVRERPSPRDAIRVTPQEQEEGHEDEQRLLAD